MKRWSLSRRLVLVLTGSLTALWLVAVIVSTAAVHHEIGEVFDSALQETAQRLLPMILDDPGEHEDGNWEHDDDHTVGGDLEYEAHEEYLIYQLRNASGKVILRSHEAPRRPFPIPLQAGFSEAGGWRFYTKAAQRQGLYIQVGEHLEHRIEAVTESLSWMIAPLIVLIPMAGLAIFWTVRRSLGPIGAAREAIRARSGTNLEPVPDTEMPDELAPIVQDVNRLIERLAQALESERGFTANSAHELRTPVATALAQAQRLEAKLAGTPHQNRVEQLVGTLRKHGNLVEKLLQLARADAGIALSREPVDVYPVLETIMDEFMRHSETGKRIRFDGGQKQTLTARTDLDALGIALRNVIENALTHGDPYGTVEIAIDESGAIHVVNQGAVVPKEQLRRLTQRFERGHTKSAGSGLGLAIADTIMSQAGGSLSLYSPARGKPDGFEAVCYLTTPADTTEKTDASR